MTTLIKNAVIYDGSGTLPYAGSLLIKDKKIEKVCRGDENTENIFIDADSIIDAEGRIVCPGFVDTHRHCDIPAVSDSDFGRVELAQGITSAIGGNCGLSFIPNSNKYRQEQYEYIAPCLGSVPADLDINSVSAYMQRLEGTSNPLHIGIFAGFGAAKAAVKGYQNTPFTAAEKDQVAHLLKEGLEAGAAGISMGIMYQPECYSDSKEIASVLKGLSSYNRVLTCHIRGEGDYLTESVEEAIAIAREAEMPLNISHFKVTGLSNWRGAIYKAIEKIESAREKGQQITVDFYPYCCGSTTLLSLLPPGFYNGNISKLYQQLNTIDGKEELYDSLNQRHHNWENMIASIGWENIVLSSLSSKDNLSLSGLNMKTASQVKGYDRPSNFMADLLVEEQGKVAVILRSMCQEDVDTVAKLPYSMVISDALYGGGEKPHPRLYGSFPKIIKEYVRERKVLTMEKAIQKMTALPAQMLGLYKRGRIAEGCYADLLIFDPERVCDMSDYQRPKCLSRGFAYVMVDGKVVCENDHLNKRYSAEVLRF